MASGRLYTDGAGSNEGARTDSVDQLSFVAGETLYFGGNGTFYYLYDSYHGSWSSRDIHYSYLDVNWYTGDGSPIMSDSSSVTVTQSMVDQGFYVTTSLDSGYSYISGETYYYGPDSSSSSLMDFDFGAGSSMQPISSALMPAGDGSGSDAPSTDGYYIYSSANPSEFYYTDGAGDMGGARPNHVDSLSFADGDTLTFAGTDTLTYYDYHGYSYTYSYSISSMDVNWYLGDGTLLLSDTSNIAVTQDMVDQGFYVSAYWEPGDWKADYAWYFDTGMSFPANDFGAGDSATPLMAAGAMPPPTGPAGPSDPSDTNFTYLIRMTVPSVITQTG